MLETSLAILLLFANNNLECFASKQVLLCVLYVLLDVVAMLFLAIPTGRFIDAYPVNISLAVGCSFDGLTLTDLDSINCDFKPSANLSLTVEECGYLCYAYWRVPVAP